MPAQVVASTEYRAGSLKCKHRVHSRRRGVSRGHSPGVPTEESFRLEAECLGGRRGSILRSDRAGAGPRGSLCVNQTVGEFEMTVAWGARSHPLEPAGRWLTAARSS